MCNLRDLLGIFCAAESKKCSLEKIEWKLYVAKPWIDYFLYIFAYRKLNYDLPSSPKVHHEIFKLQKYVTNVGKIKQYICKRVKHVQTPEWFSSWKSWLLWVKVIFTNIYKMSNVWTDSFGRYIKWLISGLLVWGEWLTQAKWHLSCVYMEIFFSLQKACSVAEKRFCFDHVVIKYDFFNF